ncbi:MAG TPA: helix-hairpin-helix domain-containing protein, partial [Polyangiales bacterium]
MTTTENSYRETSVRLGANHGYRIEGELAHLNAELAISRDADLATRQWALQLWACDAPYGGGKLSGIKVAEAALAVPESAQPQQLYAEAFARLPAAGRDYSMVLVLASGDAGAFDRVDDFANYPERERFIAPHLEGHVGFSIEGDHVVLNVERLRNPRGLDNLSGTLALELWALSEPYAGAQFSGQPLAGVELGTLTGQHTFEGIERRVALTAPPLADHWHVVLMLREWDGGSYVTRDFENLATPQAWLAPAPKRVAVIAAKPIVSEVKPVAVTTAPTKPVAVTTAPTKPIANEAAPAKPIANEAKPVSLEAKTLVVEAKPAQPSAAPRLSQPTAAAAAAKANAARASEQAESTGLVSIQSASLDELSQVKGLNKKLAAEIIKARPFRTFEDLMR